MTELISGEYEAMREAAEAVMRDTCKIGTRGAPVGDDPDNVTYTWTASISCGLEVKTRGEVIDGSQATITEAVLRLPWGTSITSASRIHITSRAGEAVSEYYALDGGPFMHLSCIRVNLQRITGASVL